MDELRKFQLMQEEMSRFEAEIAGSNAGIGGLMQPVMTAGSYGTMQQGMDMGAMHQYQHASMTAMMCPPMPPPPLPPPMLMMPQQVQHLHAYHMGPPSHHEYQPMQLQYHSMPDPQLMGLLPTPLPVTGPKVLSAKPQLYKQPIEDAKKEKRERKRKRKAERKAAEAKAKEAEAHADLGSILMPPPPPPPPLHIEVVHKPKRERKNRKVVRTAGGQVWEDVSLLEWPDDDFRMFCGDLGNDVTDELLVRTFDKYASFQRAKVVRDKRTNKSKGFGFVSFKEPGDFIRAMKEMDGRYVGSRPIKLRKSTWKHRSLDVVKRKENEKEALFSVLMTSSKN